MRRQSIHIPSLVWAITFAVIASLGVAAAFDLPISWPKVIAFGPPLLISLGILGLVLNHHLKEDRP